VYRGAVQPLRFVGYHRLADTPNVVVDGSPTASTVLTLSHWPGSPTPEHLLDDLSAQIAFRALAEPSLFDGIDGTPYAIDPLLEWADRDEREGAPDAPDPDEPA